MWINPGCPKVSFSKRVQERKFTMNIFFLFSCIFTLITIHPEIPRLVLQKITSVGQGIARFLCLSPIERRSVTSRSMVDNLSWKGRPFALSKDRGKVWANVLFLSAMMYRSHACQFFSLFCHVFAKPWIAENQKFCYHQREVQTFPLDSSDVCDFQR